MSGLRNVRSSKRPVAKKIIHLDSVLLYKGGGEGILLHVLWVDRNLVPLLKVNLGEHRASGCLGGEV